MKVAFVGANIRESVFREHPESEFGEALLKYNVESLYYVPVRNLDQTKILYHKDGKNYTIFIPCSIPFISKIEKQNLLIQRIVKSLEISLYMIRLLRRLPKDEIDVYIIYHLWTGMAVFLNPILMIFRPVAILFMGGSLLIHKEFRWLFHILSAFYKLVLHKPIILTPIDIEQKVCLFKILKIPKQNVYEFNPSCINEALFRKLSRDQCAKIVGFDTTKINIATLCRIQESTTVERLRSTDYDRNIFLVLETFRCLAQTNSMVHLHIAGRGKGMKELECKICQYDLQDRITIHGWIQHKLCPVYINAADIIINPSLLIEFNDTGAIFEAFLCGKPVVTYKRYPWVPTEQKGGFFIDKDPEKGAQQILSRLSLTYLAKKSKEAKRIPYKHDVLMGLWGKRLSEILTEVLRGK